MKEVENDIETERGKQGVSRVRVMREWHTIKTCHFDLRDYSVNRMSGRGKHKTCLQQLSNSQADRHKVFT